MRKTLHEHFEDLAKEPRLTVLTHPDNELLIYCREDGWLSFEYRQPEFGKDFPANAKPAHMLDAQWSRIDR
jgi:hypothetical protein